MGYWPIANGSSRLIVTEPRGRTLNGTTQAGPDLKRVIRDYVRAYERRHRRRKTAEDLGVSRHTLWRFLERGHLGRAVPSAVLNAVGGNIAALEAATLEIIIDLEGLRPDPALRPLREGLEEALLLLCATPLATVDELSRFGRVPASTLRERLEKLAKRGLADSLPHHLSVLGARPQRRYFPTEKGVTAGDAATKGRAHMLRAYPVSKQWFRLLAERLDSDDRPFVTLVLTHADQATRRAVRSLGDPTERRRTFVATEGELLAGDHKGVVWQQCGSGLGDDPPVRVSPDASLTGILAWTERLLDSPYSFLRDNPKPSPGALYPSGVQAAMPEPSQQLASALSVQLTPADKDALDLLAAWPLCTREQLAGMMGCVTLRRVNQVLRSLSQRGLVPADGPLHVLTD